MRFNELLIAGDGDSAEAAGLFYYLNRTGYNGLCRFNSRGGFNVPFGRYKTIDYTRRFSGRTGAPLQRWTFTNTDFEDLPLQPDDFVYADPPYDVEFTSYSTGGFDWDAQQRAAGWLVEASRARRSFEPVDRIGSSSSTRISGSTSWS